MSEWTADLQKVEREIKAHIKTLDDGHKTEMHVIKAQLSEQVIATNALRSSVDSIKDSIKQSIKEEVHHLTTDFTDKFALLFDMRNAYYKEKAEEDAEARTRAKDAAERKLKQEEDDRAKRINREDEEYEEQKKERKRRRWTFIFAILAALGMIGGYIVYLMTHVKFNVSP